MKFVCEAFRRARKCYDTRIDAEINRKRGERTYYAVTKGYLQC